MKIYFAGSIRGGRQDKDIYAEIIKHLSALGVVLTEHVGYDGNITQINKQKSQQEIFTQDVNWLSEADVIVAEVTTPSLGVGYEIGVAEKLGKKIICLHRQDIESVSAMIAGNPNVGLLQYETVSQAIEKITQIISPA